VRVTKWTVAQGVAAAMVLIVALAAWRLTVAAGHSSARTARWEAVAGGVQADVAVGHVWLEERLAGDRTINVQRDILGNFDRARARCAALRTGGTSPGESGRVAAVDDPQLRAEVVALTRMLDGLRALTVQRLVRRTVAGTPADQRYDARFRAALALAQRLPVRIGALSRADEARLKVIETGAIVLLGATLLLAVAIIRAAQRQLERLARERETVLESAGEGILAVDADGRIRFANATAGVLLGWSSRELAGRPVGELIPDARLTWPGALEAGAGRGTAELLHRDGTRVPIEYTATAADADGARTSLVITFRDATARHRRDRERDAELAELRAMRATLVPADLPQRADLRFATCFVPAVSGVAGDFYLVAAGPGDTTIVVVGDVSGKGIAAAQCAAFVRTSLATFAPYTASPSRLLELANRALAERGHDFEMLATAACAVVDPAAERVTWALAGHPAPLRLDSGVAVSVKPGLPLGLEPELGARETVVPLGRGDGFVLFTDALYEARSGARDGQSEHFGLDRIGELVAGLAAAEPAEVVRALRGEVETFTDGALTDDLCVVAFRFEAVRVSARRLPIRSGARADRAASAAGRQSRAARESDRQDSAASD
jgi:PAS domain S-box-containing protein